MTYRRVRHIITENQRVLDTVAALRTSGAAAIGPFLNESHVSMRDDFEISTPELDLAVASAQELGAIGARMTGGGFGGAAIALVRNDDAGKVAEGIARNFAAAGYTAPHIFPVTASEGARRDSSRLRPAGQSSRRPACRRLGPHEPGGVGQKFHGPEPGFGAGALMRHDQLVGVGVLRELVEVRKDGIGGADSGVLHHLRHVLALRRVQDHVRLVVAEHAAIAEEQGRPWPAWWPGTSPGRRRPSPRQ